MIMSKTVGNPTISSPSHSGNQSDRDSQQNIDDDNALNIYEDTSNSKAQNQASTKRKWAECWNHFILVHDINEKGRKVKKWKCKYCSKKYSTSDSGSTTTLNRHIESCHQRKLQPSQGKHKSFNPKNTNIDDVDAPIANPVQYNQAKIENIIAKMIIVHEYPFMIVEHFWFNELMKAMNPAYHEVSKQSIKAKCLKIFESERDKLMNLLKSVDKISLTCDFWTSEQSIEYLCITAHFIDSEWKLQHHVLSFMDLDPPYTGLVISDAIIECLMKWGIQSKIITVTSSNTFLNDIAACSLKEYFEARRYLFLKGKFFHIKCCAQVLNVMVQECLKYIENIISTIRMSVIYIKKSPARLHRFAQMAKQKGICTSKELCLDVPSRWNSTYYMLEAAFHYKIVFKEYAKTEAGVWLPSSKDWDTYEKIRDYFRVFEATTKVLSGITDPTSNKFLTCMVNIKQILDKAIVSDDLTAKLALSIKDKFDEYWGEFDLLLSIACILDPRRKLLVIQYSFPHIYPKEVADVKIEEVRQTLFDFYTYYSIDPYEIRESGEQISIQVDSSEFGLSKSTIVDDVLVGFDEFVSSAKVSQPLKSDLDIYLEEPVVKCADADFGILDWWRMNTIKFPCLSKMAKDILTIPITTSSSEPTFGTSGSVLSNYKSSFGPKTVNNLICAGSWLRACHKNVKNPIFNVLEEEELNTPVLEDSLLLSSRD